MTLWMVLMSFFNDISTAVPEKDYVYENIVKGCSHLSVHGGSVCFQVVPFVELE